MRKVFLVFRSIFLIPHLIVFKCCKNHDIICADLKRWAFLCPDGEKRGYSYIFLYLMCYFKEYRNLFYRRLYNSQYILRIFCKPLSSLYLISRNLGEGFFIQHGFSTIVGVESVGKNCWVNQNVTIGHTAKGRPVIGDNVTIGSGAIILGDIKIGNNVTIGAGTVVVKDVPDNCVVVGSKAYIVKRDGQRVYEEL